MGCRRGRRAEHRQNELTFAPEAVRVYQRRSARWVRCGVFFLIVGLSACRNAPSAPAANSNELIVGFPEGGVTAADLGISQFTGALSQEGLMSATGVDGRPVPRLAESAE